MKKFENLNIDDIIVILLYYRFMLSDNVVNIKIQKPYNYSRALLFIKRQKINKKFGLWTWFFENAFRSSIHTLRVQLNILFRRKCKHYV